MILIAGAENRLSKALQRDYNASGAFAFEVDASKMLDEMYFKELIDIHNPDIVFNCHEFSKIDDAEYHREEAYNHNSFAAKALATACRRKNVFMVQLSTPYVFSGEKQGLYSENDKAEPISVYGDSKLLGERLIGETGCGHLIIRIGEFYNNAVDIINSNFLKINPQSEVEVIRNQIISPVSSYEFIEALRNLLEFKAEGLFHFNSSDSVSSGNFLREMIECEKIIGKNGFDFNINEIDAKDFLAPAERPINTLMDTSKYTKLTDKTPRPWLESLRDLVKKEPRFFPEQ